MSIAFLIKWKILTVFFEGEVWAAVSQGMLVVGVVRRRRRARPAPGHAATEHPPSDHFGAFCSSLTNVCAHAHSLPNPQLTITTTMRDSVTPINLALCKNFVQKV